MDERVGEFLASGLRARNLHGQAFVPHSRGDYAVGSSQMTIRPKSATAITGTARCPPFATVEIILPARDLLVWLTRRLSAASDDVSFDGLARTVATALQREGVRMLIVMAHAHASGTALQMAGNAPEMVLRLSLLDASGA